MPGPSSSLALFVESAVEENFHQYELTDKQIEQERQHRTTNTHIDKDGSGSGEERINGAEFERMEVGDPTGSPLTFYASFGSSASWVVNWCLLFSKLVILIISGSKVIAASFADSAVDLVSQGVLSLAERYISKHSPDYPVGRSRLEALSVLACAAIMAFASVEIIQFSCVDLYDGFTSAIPVIEVNSTVYGILVAGTVLKLLLYVYCLWANKVVKYDGLAALAEDHLNDVMSNSAALVSLSVAFYTPAWYVDPIAAIVISLVIIGRWAGIMQEQIKKIVGHTAPRDFIDQMEEVARAHDSRLTVDVTRAYHFGARYNVEMEIVLPGRMTVMESHDIALALQHKIESHGDVERAFVHVDHSMRDGLEHKVERELVQKGASADVQLSVTAGEGGLRNRRGAAESSGQNSVV